MQYLEAPKPVQSLGRMLNLWEVEEFDFCLYGGHLHKMALNCTAVEFIIRPTNYRMLIMLKWMLEEQLI